MLRLSERVRAAVLAVGLFLASAVCIVPSVIADPTTIVQAQQEWERIDRFDIDAVRSFLSRHPARPLKEKITHRLALMEKLEAIERGKRSARTIPFSTLAPSLAEWFDEHRHDDQKTICLYFVYRSEGLMGDAVGTMLGEPTCKRHSIETGTRWPALGRGTIIAIRTNEMEYRWPEDGGTFVSDHQSTLFFGVLPSVKGLVFLEGKGRYIAVDGTKTELSE